MAQEAKNKSNISSSDPLLDKGWFTVRDCYQSVDIHPLPCMESLNSKEKHFIAMAFYSILYLGKRPANFPDDLGGALAIFLYNNLCCGCMYREKRRAFLDMEGLPADVKEQFTPKCGIPSELMDTASGLKAWACEHILALDGDEGLLKAFEDSGTYTRGAEELAKKVGEAVAQQLHPEKGAEKHREHLALLSASIFRYKKEDSFIKLFAFFLRLVVQTPKQLVDYYMDTKKRDEMVTSWAELYESKSFIKLFVSQKFLNGIHDRLVALRPAITHHVAIGLAHVLTEQRLEHQPCKEDSAALAYQELTKWFLLRMEYYGLALLQLPCENSYRLRRLEDIKNVLRMITTTTNVAQLVALLAALLIYVNKKAGDQELDGKELVLDMTIFLLRNDEEEDKEKKEAQNLNMVKILEKIFPNLPTLQLPNFNEYDRCIGQFAKCFSPKYMPWLSFNFNRETSALLLRGIYPAFVSKSAATEPNSHEKWTYADESRIELYRNDPLIHPKFLETLETAHDDILYRACKQNGSLRMELVGFLIGQAILDEEDEGESELWKQVSRQIKKEKEDKKEEKRRLLRAQEEAQNQK